MLPKNVKHCTAEDLKAENNSVYDQVYDLGRQSANAEIAKLKTENIIRKNAYKLNLGEFGEGLIAEGMSTEAALESLITESQKRPVKLEEVIKPNQELKGVLEATASSPAGAGSEGDNSPVPKTMQEAIDLELKTLGGDEKQMKQAVKNARKNYSKLFIPQD